MSTPANDDPKGAPVNRGLLTIVIVLGVLIVLAFAALVIGFVTRLGGGHRSVAVADGTGPVQYALPAGSKILQAQVTTGNRIIMTVQTPAGNEVDIFDTDTGRLVSQIKPASAR